MRMRVRAQNVCTIVFVYVVRTRAMHISDLLPPPPSSLPSPSPFSLSLLPSPSPISLSLLPLPSLTRYEAMDQQQQRIKDLREVPEAEAVRKLCVQITRQYLDEIKMEDELRDRMAAGHGNGMMWSCMWVYCVGCMCCPVWPQCTVDLVCV